MKNIVGIIGGKGKTGSQFAGIFKKLGFDVLVSDIGTKLSNKELIKKSDVVVFSVPLHLSEKIIKNEIVNCKNPDQVVLDVSSLKEKQVEAMNKANGNVIGMHPLFGPSVKSFKGLSMVLCSGKCSKEVFEKFKKMFEKVGLKIAVMSPSQHDKLMAAVQVIPHLKTIFAGELLKDFGINPSGAHKISTPIYKLELDIIGRIFSQDGMLYGAIISHNPYTRRIMKTLSRVVSEYCESIGKCDLKGMNNRFNSVKKFLGKFTDEAFRDSEKIINEMQKWK
jgi:prephenate dehydrogenase